MRKTPVIILRTEHGHEVLTDTARCVKRGDSEYECHLFLHEHSLTYKVHNTTSKVGQQIIERRNMSN